MRIFANSPRALHRVFGCFGTEKRIVSLVGGGGKSTLMYFMAATCAREGKRVLVTTTTRIYRPAPEYLASTREETLENWRLGRFAVVGTPLPGGRKLGPPRPELLEELTDLADVVFVEADGARHCPVKVPGPCEPVLLPGSDLVLAVMGLSGLGQPLSGCCFRPELAGELLEREPEHLLTEADAALLLASPLAGRKCLEDRDFGVILNQCDDGKRRRSAGLIAGYLADAGITQVVMTAFDPEEQKFYNTVAGVPEEK